MPAGVAAYLMLSRRGEMAEISRWAIPEKNSSENKQKIFQLFFDDIDWQARVGLLRGTFRIVQLPQRFDELTSEVGRSTTFRDRLPAHEPDFVCTRNCPLRSTSPRAFASQRCIRARHARRFGACVLETRETCPVQPSQSLRNSRVNSSSLDFRHRDFLHIYFRHRDLRR